MNDSKTQISYWRYFVNSLKTLLIEHGRVLTARTTCHSAPWFIPNLLEKPMMGIVAFKIMANPYVVVSLYLYKPLIH